MELKDVRIGMTVVDKFGNEYIVKTIDDSYIPLYLECTKFVKECKIDGDAVLEGVGFTLWVVNSEESYKKYSGHNVDISLVSLKQKI